MIFSFLKTAGRTLTQVLTGAILGHICLFGLTFIFEEPERPRSIEEPSFPLQASTELNYAMGNLSTEYFGYHFRINDTLLQRLKDQGRLELNDNASDLLYLLRDYEKAVREHQKTLLDDLSERLKQIYKNTNYRPSDPVAGLPLENRAVGNELFNRNVDFLSLRYYDEKLIQENVRHKDSSPDFYYAAYPFAPDFFDYLGVPGIIPDQFPRGADQIQNYFINCRMIEGIAIINLLQYRAYFLLYQLHRYLLLHRLSPYKKQLRPRILKLDLTEEGKVKKQQLYSLFPLNTRVPLQIKWEEGDWQKLNTTNSVALPLQQGQLHIWLGDPYFATDIQLKLQAKENGAWSLEY